MRTVRGMVLALAVAVLAAAAAEAKPRRVKLYRAGDVFCTSRTLVWGGGSVVVRDRCYLLGLVRKPEGTFLAFLDPGLRVPPGQLVRLNTPAGAKLRGRILYLVPVQTVVAVPVDTLVIVPVRVEGRRPAANRGGDRAPGAQPDGDLQRPAVIGGNRAGEGPLAASGTL